EHYFIDKFTAQILGHSVVSSEYEISILTNNLFGVDINEESVEITKLALRLRTSKPNRKLKFLDANIKCGNSLISDPKIDHDKSFDWRKEFPRIFERGGFDVVIGNPPYVFSRGGKFSEIEKEYYYSSYPLSNYQLNTYLLFIDLAYYHLLRDGGVFGFIVPNNCLTIDTFQPFRKFLLEQTGGVEVVNIINNVFKDANVDNCIITFKKQNADKISIGEMNDEKLTMIGTFPTSIFAKEQYIINIAIAKKPETAKLVEKIENKGRRLSDASVIKAGLKAYETGKGQPTQTDKMKKQRIYHSDYQKNKRYKKYLMGKDVCRYSLDWGGQWLKYGVNLASPRSYEIFSSPRILVRQIPSRYPSCINAVYTDELFLNDINSMIIFDFKIDPLYLLGILNSRLTSFWFINKFDKFQRAIFPQFKIKELALFPVIICDNNKQKTIADWVDKMISFHAELRLKRKKFFKLIADFFENVQQLKIVENLDQLEYKEFLEILNCSRLNIRLKPSSCLSKRQILRSNDAEIHNASRISKRKIKFDVENQSALEKIFNDYQSTCRNISKQIIETNRKIDQLVYELYELNDEEIKIIET
ncbi:MAG: N-6 DNA methylase, partial [Planctomycetaceae bacterium]|nr:N-6 DNA methylase [Planctomycetaceae bacterium]